MNKPRGGDDDAAAPWQPAGDDDDWQPLTALLWEPGHDLAGHVRRCARRSLRAMILQTGLAWLGVFSAGVALPAVLVAGGALGLWAARLLWSRRETRSATTYVVVATITAFIGPVAVAHATTALSLTAPTLPVAPIAVLPLGYWFVAGRLGKHIGAASGPGVGCILVFVIAAVGGAAVEPVLPGSTFASIVGVAVGLFVVMVRFAAVEAAHARPPTAMFARPVSAEPVLQQRRRPSTPPAGTDVTESSDDELADSC
jgi:hypothetical protein